MARLRCSSLNGRGIADFDEFIHKKFHIILRSCLEAFYFDPTTLIEIAVYGGPESVNPEQGICGNSILGSTVDKYSLEISVDTFVHAAANLFVNKF